MADSYHASRGGDLAVLFVLADYNSAPNAFARVRE
jgi:hypothetical protein